MRHISFNVGEFITMAEGEYSDYCVNGLFRVVHEFNLEEVFERYGKDTNQTIINGEISYEDINPDAIGFMPYLLITLGFIQEIDYKEIHLGCYGTISPR